MDPIYSYYFSFERTGVEEIDKILEAVAAAGKSYHHTEWWGDDSDGPAPVSYIQDAANEAAAILSKKGS